MRLKHVLSLLTACTFVIQSFSQSPLWVNTQAGTGDNSDKFYVIKSDLAGNLICAGYTFGTGTNWDALLVKMTSAGDTLWTRTFNGTGNGIDKFLFMSVDGADNIYVSGTTDGAGTGDDLLTMKYNGSGALQWSATYNYAPYNENEGSAGIEVASTGDVYVTGWSDRDSTQNTNNDIVTVKYNASGVQQWANRYNGLGNSTDEAIGITLDNLENPVIVGRTNVAGGNDNMITIKYTTTGTISWTANFDRGAAKDDKGVAIIADGSGNIIVTGSSNNTSDDDIAIIKYNSLGVQQFATYYNNGNNDYPDAMALGTVGVIYLVGHTDVLPGAGGDYDYVVLKISATGVIQWSTVYGNPINKDDDPSDITLDVSNNIYITGKSDSSTTTTKLYDWLTIKLNSSGVMQWAKYHYGTNNPSDDTGEGVLLKSSTLYVVGTAQNSITQKDATVISYNTTTGAKTVIKNYNGKGDFTDKTNAIVTDKLNNVYSVGYVRAPEQGKNIFIQKVNASGVTQWFKSYDFTNEDDEANAITLDTLGNMYVCGYSNGNGTGNDFILLKLNSLGDTVWTRTYDFTGENDIAVSVLLNTAATNIFITGYSDATPTAYKNYDIATLKYNTAGTQLAVVRYSGAAGGADKPVKMVFNSNSLFLAGNTWNGTNNDLITIKYNLSLVQQYASILSIDASSNESADDITVDAGNAYVAGNSYSAAQLDNYTLVKYNSTGVQQWVSSYNGPASLTDKPNALCVTAAGVFITGRSALSATDTSDILTIKYDKNTGAQNWLSRYSRSSVSDDRGTVIAADKFNNICIAGRSTDATSKFDMATLIYDPAGNRKFTAFYNGAGASDDYSTAMAFSTEGYLYQGGYTTNIAGNFDITTLKYCTPSIAYAGADVSICKGASTTLSASGGGTYSWSPATGLNNTTIATPIAKPTVTTTYVVTVNNGLGCGTATDTVVVTVNPTPNATITAGGATTICVGTSVTLTANAGAGYTYQWYNGVTPITGATAITYAANATGSYKVEVFNAFGCSKKSKATNVTVITCDEGMSSVGTEATVFPVPFSGSATLVLSNTDASHSFNIYNLTGQVVESGTIPAGTIEREIGDQLQEGVYFIEIVAEGEKQILRLVKTK